MAAAYTQRRRRRRRSDLRAAVAFLLPGFLGLAAFLILPLFASLALSFSNWQVIGQTRFVGLANYVNLFTRDPIFWGVFRVTLLYTAEYLVLNVVLSLGMAVWIGSLSWGKQLFRLVFFLPTFTPLVGIALVWLLMLTPGGIVDGGFAALGLPVPNLITSPAYALQVVVIVSLWSHFGYNLLLFGAALESIPSTYEARRRGQVPRVTSAARHLGIAITAALFLFPFFWMLSNALRMDREIFAMPPRLLPSSVQWYNFVAAWRYLPFGRFFLNRVLVQIGSTDMRVPDAPYNLQARSTAFQTAGAVRP